MFYAQYPSLNALCCAKIEIRSRYLLFYAQYPSLRRLSMLRKDRSIQSRDERTEIQFFVKFCDNLHGSLHRVGETGGKKRKGEFRRC